MGMTWIRQHCRGRVHMQRDDTVLYNHVLQQLNGNVELSEMTFEDAIAFVNEYEMAA